MAKYDNRGGRQSAEHGKFESTPEARSKPIARYINFAKAEIDEFLRDKNQSITSQERGFLEWVQAAVHNIDEKEALEELKTIDQSPIEGLIDSLEILARHGVRGNSVLVQGLYNASTDYFRSKFGPGKEHGIGMTKEDSDRQHPFTEREAYFISQPNNSSYREYLVDKYSYLLPQWDNLRKDQQDYYLAMQSLGNRRVVDLKRLEKQEASEPSQGEDQEAVQDNSKTNQSSTGKKSENIRSEKLADQNYQPPLIKSSDAISYEEGEFDSYIKDTRARKAQDRKSKSQGSKENKAEDQAQMQADTTEDVAQKPDIIPLDTSEQEPQPSSEDEKPQNKEVKRQGVDELAQEIKTEFGIQSELAFSEKLGNIRYSEKIKALGALKDIFNMILKNTAPGELERVLGGLEEINLGDSIGLRQGGKSVNIKLFLESSSGGYEQKIKKFKPLARTVWEMLKSAAEKRNKKSQGPVDDLQRAKKEEDLSESVAGDEGLEKEEDKLGTEESESPQGFADNQPETIGTSIEEVEPADGEKTAEEVMDLVEIHGDDKTLTKEFLFENGILPEYRLDGLDRDILSSRTFDFAEGYVGAILFVEDHGKYVARSYYRSRSGMAVWRYAPAHFGKHISKGNYNKNSVAAPILIQEYLSEIKKQDHKEDIDMDVAQRIFYGATKIKAEDRYRQGDEENYTYYGSGGVEQKAVRIAGNLGDEIEFNTRQLPPEEIEITDQLARPDFTKVGKDSWKERLVDPLTGQMTDVEIDSIPSQDGKFNYMFCWQKQAGRGWLGMVELSNSEISATGLRKQWVDVGRLATPTADYAEHDPQNYGEAVEGSSYRDMFPRYVSQIPEVQKYIACKKALDNIEK